MKQELIEAIKATIVPNDKKAITAESLANLLTEMVEAMGEGSGGGAGQIVFYLGVPDEQSVEGELSMQYLTTEEKEHNIKMFKIIKDSPMLPVFSMDASGVMSIKSGVEGFKVNLVVVFSQFMSKDSFQNLPEEEQESMPEILRNKDILWFNASIIGGGYIFEDGNIALPL